jgi:hypothetical protein
LEVAEAGAAEALLGRALLDLAHAVISLCAYGAGLSGVSEANGTGNHTVWRRRTMFTATCAAVQLPGAHRPIDLDACTNGLRRTASTAVVF